MEYKLTTDVYKQGLIEQKLTLERESDTYNANEILSTWLVNVREKHIHDALIELGWTPPNDYE